MSPEKRTRTRLSLNQWAQTYAAMGNPIRLGILFVLYGSNIADSTPCLRFNQIKEITGIASDSALTHHLSRLLDAGLITKEAFKDENEQVFPIYSASPRWNKLVKQAGLHTIISDILSDDASSTF